MISALAKMKSKIMEEDTVRLSWTTPNVLCQMIEIPCAQCQGLRNDFQVFYVMISWKGCLLISWTSVLHLKLVKGIVYNEELASRVTLGQGGGGASASGIHMVL
jgi:hypothetical protein